jgi:ligand-binding sensor domain-containing protein/signal transduction histidine kinase
MNWQTISDYEFGLFGQGSWQATKTRLLTLGQFVALLFCSVFTSQAQQLAIRGYDVAEGLAHNTVSSMYQDKKGYVWFSTFEGLSRFDGYHFVNYGTPDGLGHVIINQVTEDRQGRLWVATNGGGVARLLEADASFAGRTPRQKFIGFAVGPSVTANKVNHILFDASGEMWCATDAGLYRARANDERPEFKTVIQSGAIYAALEDRRGRLWFGVDNGLIEWRGGQIISHGRVGASEVEQITGIIEEWEERDDGQGKLLVAGFAGLFEFTPPAGGGGRGPWRRIPLKLGPKTRIHALLKDAAGALWLGTDEVLIKYQYGEQTHYTTAQGLGADRVRALAADRDGNLWVGTEGGGAGKIGGAAMISYTQADGLPGAVVAQVLEDGGGRAWALMETTGLLAEINTGLPRLSRQLDYPRMDAASTTIVSEKTGVWAWMSQSRLWIGALLAKPVWQSRGGRKIDLTRLGLSKAAPAHFLFYEDEAERLWFSKREGRYGNGDGRIYRANLARPGPWIVESFPADFTLGGATQRLMISDGAGGLWLGKQEMLGRLRQGKFMRLTPTDGLPETDPRCFFLDSRGWLWIGLRYGGVSMTREPGAEHPRFVNYSIAQGLSSHAVWSIIEDDSGRLYFGTDKGLDQYDPRANRWRRYTHQDGLASDTIFHLHKDPRGCVWVSTPRGLTRFDPRAERTAHYPAPVYFNRVNIAGEDLPLPASGVASLSPIELPPARNNLSIEFVGLQFTLEDGLNYQYRLEGVDADWSPPGKARVVNYARLGPGNYRFLARAITADGALSASPAMFAFRILPPFYLRWWFLTLAALTIGLMVYVLYRYRVTRLLELERVRLHIATDLHDDIGTSLARVAILSEVVKRQVAAPQPDVAPLLTEIADSARGMAETMREIVWAIDPRRDEVGDLAVRVRTFAADVLEARGINCEFQVAPELERIKLAPQQRRQLFLIFKEAINNIARHTDSRCVWLGLSITRQELRGEIRDDGCGFESASPLPAGARGQGLDNMRRRTAQLGGQVTITSTPGSGTHIKLRLPLKRR